VHPSRGLLGKISLKKNPTAGLGAAIGLRSNDTPCQGGDSIHLGDVVIAASSGKSKSALCGVVTETL
jgi:hypothetical protein